jgi:hypothetical protein
MSVPASQVRPTNGAALAFDVLAGLFTLAALVVASATWPDGGAGVAPCLTATAAVATPAVLCAGFSAVLRRMRR